MLGYTAAEVMNKITPADISDPQELVARATALSVEAGTTITPGFEALVFKASRRIEDIYELTYADVNKQTEALTGCTRDELIGSPFKNYFTDSSRAEAGINRVLGEGKVTNYELTACARDGTLTVVSSNATTFHDRDRRLQGVVVAARDVTELKRFEEALKQKNVELEAASRMKSEFLANMSHELRTPLNAIIGFSEVLKDGLVGEMTEQQRGFIGDIFNSGKHLLSLINDILDLSKIEAGKMVLDLEPVQVSSLFQNSLAIIREKAAIRHVSLKLDAGENLGSIHVDARKVKQIVYNLLSNAVKFTSEGGLMLARAERPNLILMDIQLPGIDGLEAIALLKRDDATRTMPLITALAMKGDEERQADALSRISHDSRESAGPMSPWVLIVDDERDNRELLNIILTHEGFRVRTAASGACERGEATTRPHPARCHAPRHDRLRGDGRDQGQSLHEEHSRHHSHRSQRSRPEDDCAERWSRAHHQTLGSCGPVCAYEESLAPR